MGFKKWGRTFEQLWVISRKRRWIFDTVLKSHQLTAVHSIVNFSTLTVYCLRPLWSNSCLHPDAHFPPAVYEQKPPDCPLEVSGSEPETPHCFLVGIHCSTLVLSSNNDCSSSGSEQTLLKTEAPTWLLYLKKMFCILANTGSCLKQKVLHSFVPKSLLS